MEIIVQLIISQLQRHTISNDVNSVSSLSEIEG